MKKKKYCPICKKDNHYEKDCFIRYSKMHDTSNNKTTFLATQSFFTSNTTDCILDSRSSHKNNKKNILSMSKPLSSEIGVTKKNETRQLLLLVMSTLIR